MSKLSEDEIIKMLKEYSATNPFQKNMFYVSNLHEAIQGLLDLYNKEKEKNKKLENDISEMYYKGVVLDILQDELNISRDEAIEILENY